MRVAKLKVQAVFQVVDEDNTVVDEIEGDTICMFPGKCYTIVRLIELLEERANRDSAVVEQIAKRSIW